MIYLILKLIFKIYFFKLEEKINRFLNNGKNLLIVKNYFQKKQLGFDKD